mmetsp:Transcript_24170/g.54959  ORF Transcript_24170/g.54959 Transcript_24170/m.54959 type:complete len:104 (-) Transcript_24170:331-642(-)
MPSVHLMCGFSQGLSLSFKSSSSSDSLDSVSEPSSSCRASSSAWMSMRGVDSGDCVLDSVLLDTEENPRLRAGPPCLTDALEDEEEEVEEDKKEDELEDAPGV